MTFTTPCFVRVENPEKRKELTEWLNNIGRRPTSYSESDRSPWFIAYATGRFCQANGFHIHPEMAQKNGYINCGKNIELFKALAAMNDENDREQWFTNGVNWGIFRSIPPPKGYEHWGDTEGMEFFCLPNSLDIENYRKATAEEIVEYFKNNK